MFGKFRVIPDSIGLLSQLKELNVIDCCELSAFPQSVSAMESLTSLVLDGCDLHELPGDIGQLSNLVSLKLSNLPPGFETLSKLRTLYLFNCVFASLPDRFGDLPSLEVLRIGTKATYSRNRLETGSESDYGDELEGACALHMLPQSLVRLTGLVELVLEGCEMLEELPPGMGGLSSLRVLEVRNCPQLRLFPSLLSPPVVAAAAATPAPPFPSLEQLEISDCPRLESLPEGLHLLPRLEHLALEDCPSLELTHPSPLPPPTSPTPQSNTFLSALSPPSTSPSSPPLVAPISLPISMKTIILSNVFQSAQYLPESLLSLAQLTHLNIYDLPSLQQLIAPSLVTQSSAYDQATHNHQSERFDSDSDVPARLDLFPSLQHLHIALSNLSALSETVGNLAQLKVLLLEECPAMTSLPASLTSLSNLQQLTLKSLPLLTHMPENIGQLKALRNLSLESCQALKALPFSVTLLSSLMRLTIEDCPNLTRLHLLSLQPCLSLSHAFLSSAASPPRSPSRTSSTSHCKVASA
ncbi:unnamed protein product [Closterium sp. Naga37s-1]|nr:unnamed protein product [Closterium sp. Naga37s-1]